MLRKAIDRIFKTQLALKIWFYTFLLTLAVLFSIGFSSNNYFNKYIVRNSINNAKKETTYVASSFSANYTDILRRFVRLTVSADFKAAAREILNCDAHNYVNTSNDLQDIFNDYIDMSSLIKSAMIVRISKPNVSSALFYSYYCLLDKNITTYDLGFDLSEITGITILKYTKKPFTNQNEVLPIVIPLQYNASLKILQIPDQIDSADLILYLFLGTEEIKSFLELYCNDNFQGILYLTDSNGQNLSLSDDLQGADMADQPGLAAQIKETIAKHHTFCSSQDNYVYIHQIKDIDLYLVNVIPHGFFKSKSNAFHTGLIWIGLISTILITGLSLMISIFVTKPLKKLMLSVHEIETGQYRQKTAIKTKDEIGQLNEAIDSMYNTIQQQIIIIKQEEKEKYHAQIQLLTEQINPHFIYNALEFINMELLNFHNDNASAMISSLGDYLRIGLAYGETQLLISQEIDQVIAYVNIMNFRYNNKIKVTTHIPDTLSDRKILKNILQPLVENSLKHGFKLTMNSPLIIPIIHIELLLDENYLTLSVMDNGSGFDTVKVREIMQNNQTTGDTGKHVGLYNIYRRLTAFYGDVQVSLSSVPFLENKISIQLPSSHFLL